MNQAQLITPEGKTIVLPEQVYFKVKEFLEEKESSKSMTRAQIQQVIKETFGKYTSEYSMTEALLQMRREERALEEAKYARLAGLGKGKRRTKTNALRSR